MVDAAAQVEMPKPKIEERAAADRGGWGMLGVALLLMPLGAAAVLAGVAAAGASPSGRGSPRGRCWCWPGWWSRSG
ncbi:hypothetical protein LUX39_10630 [Actinomadura madurae]|nr:hypothetical protein [Actinomadura madurae]MCP9965502.1 hypothetical protein [Actinomadura madurae]MCQ0010513.1 hypothetical protein [Actinomadura madurae]MCQ0014177.1 hypothetical protein [Actinomadura madurae]